MKAKVRVFMLALLLVFPAMGVEPVKPAKENKCPVCGMFVAKYPEWVAQAHFRDGRVVFFDGVKDFFHFYFNVGKYAPGRTQKEMTTIFVTDYYRVEPIDGRQAFYVAGSDVYGPMGRELIPFATRAEAEEFFRDHGGRTILKFGEVTQRFVVGLE